VRTIVRMAAELGIGVVAEGVETPGQLAILGAMGCDSVQGFLLARPGATPAAVGHRIFHGGEFQRSVRIGPAVRARIAALAELAPLHNPPGLETLAAADNLAGGGIDAVFDTAFHASLPPAARSYALPGMWTLDWGIRRYGFHGLSHAYWRRRAAALLDRPPDSLRLVIRHLGHGCSASAVRGGAHSTPRWASRRSTAW
jgi:acetate kinase